MFIVAFIVGGWNDPKIPRNSIFVHGAEIIMYHFIVLQITLSGHIVNTKVSHFFIINLFYQMINSR